MFINTEKKTKIGAHSYENNRMEGGGSENEINKGNCLLYGYSMIFLFLFFSGKNKFDTQTRITIDINTTKYTQHTQTPI